MKDLREQQRLQKILKWSSKNAQERQYLFAYALTMFLYLTEASVLLAERLFRMMSDGDIPKDYISHEARMWFNKAKDEVEKFSNHMANAHDKVFDTVYNDDVVFCDAIQWNANDIIQLLTLYHDRISVDKDQCYAIKEHIAKLPGSDNDNYIKDFIEMFIMQ